VGCFIWPGWKRTEDPEDGNVSKAIGSSIPNFTIFMGGIPNIKIYAWFHYCSTNHILTLWESNTATENPRFSLDNHLENDTFHFPAQIAGGETGNG
jgi:hypothetical protein